MLITVLDSFKEQDVFNLDKFEIKFTNNDNVYTAIVYLTDSKTICLGKSKLITKNFSGEYWLNGHKIVFYISIILEDYYKTKNYNNFMKFTSFTIN